MIGKVYWVLACQFIYSAAFAQSPVDKGYDAITESAVRGQLGFLASDWTEGRAVGTRGAYLAADYIASVFELYGIEPFGDQIRTSSSRRSRMMESAPEVRRSFFQNFSLLEYAPGKEQSLKILNADDSSESSVSFNYKTDFYVYTGSVGQNAQAPIVFAGYGLSDDKKNYDDLKKVNLRGKIVLILEGFPGHADPGSGAYNQFAPVGRYAQYYFERNKIERLEKLGVKGIIVASTGKDPSLEWAQNQVYPVKGDYYEADSLLSSYYDTRISLPGDSLTTSVPVFTVSIRVANAIIAGTGIRLDAFEEQAANKLTPGSKDIPDRSIFFSTTVDSRIIKARNVLGYIEGKNKDEYIVVGGHYDHVGKWNGWIWNGADDNASGTVGVMTIAKAFKATGEKPEKSVIFAAWTGEEKGLWGSKYFVSQALKQKMNVVLNLNYDMIGRDEEDDTLKNKASMVYTRKYTNIEAITKENLQAYDINLDLRYRASDRPSGGSDHAPFAQAGIPVFYFMAAMHPDYHQPSDELDKINWEKMTNIIRIGFLNTWNFANSNQFLKSEEPVSEN